MRSTVLAAIVIAITATAAPAKDVPVHYVHGTVHAGEILTLKTPQRFKANAAMFTQPFINNHALTQAVPHACSVTAFGRLTIVDAFISCKKAGPIVFKITTLLKRARVDIGYWKDTTPKPKEES